MIKKATPRNPLGYIKLYRFYVRQDKPEKALEALEEGYSQNPRSAPLLMGLVQEYVRQNKHQTAIALCEERIDKNSKDVISYLSVRIRSEQLEKLSGRGNRLSKSHRPSAHVAAAAPEHGGYLPGPGQEKGSH